jgi:hypothetical protein
LRLKLIGTVLAFRKVNLDRRHVDALLREEHHDGDRSAPNPTCRVSSNYSYDPHDPTTHRADAVAFCFTTQRLADAAIARSVPPSPP